MIIVIILIIVIMMTIKIDIIVMMKVRIKITKMIIVVRIINDKDNDKTLIIDKQRGRFFIFSILPYQNTLRQLFPSF